MANENGGRPRSNEAADYQATSTLKAGQTSADKHAANRAEANQANGNQPAQPPQAMVLCSGGVDSTTLLAMAVRDYGAENVVALSISYGQKHIREIDSAKAVAAHYGVQQRFLDLAPIFADSNCSLLSHSDQDIPEESYAQQQAEGDGHPVSTYVPFRNGLFLASAASMALSCGCSKLYYGAHHDDWAGNAYPDCSQAFVDAMRRAIEEGTGGELTLEAPFVQWNKAGIVREGLALGVPYELTWSCYEGGAVPCGRCGTCIDRAAAFAANNVEDPLLVKLRENGAIEA